MNPTNRTFLGAGAHALKSIFLSTAKTVEVMDEGIAMAHKAVRTARKKQAVEIALSMEDFVSRTVEQAALQRAQERKEILAFRAQSEENKNLFDSAYSQLKAAVDAELATFE